METITAVLEPETEATANPAPAAAPEASPREETMADYEDKLDPEAFEADKWNRLKERMAAKETFSVTVKGVVKGGVIAFVDELRAFIPSSHIALHHVENLEEMLEKELQVRIIEVDPAKKRLLLSAREVLRDAEREEQKKAMEAIPVGARLHGTVETLKPYGAFIRLENGLSGLVHVSQVARRRIKTPAEVLKVGEEVDVKVIAFKDGKLSLSIKELLDGGSAGRNEAAHEHVVIPKAEKLSVNLGELLKGINVQ